MEKFIAKKEIFFANFQPQNFIKGMFSHKFTVSIENICQILEGKPKKTNISHKHLLHFHTVGKLSQRHLE
jgi:hypothetical protein